MVPPLDADEVPAWVGVRVSVVGRLISAKPCEQIAGQWRCLIVPKDERCGYFCYVREGRARGLTERETYSVSGDFLEGHLLEGQPPMWTMSLDNCDLDWHFPDR